ncbi:hypothetical protein [Methyloversatilis universalis]|uniref:hypothetical protein n=1 Tax=Methyloversatilis universalis TaxID=378211 RepID=UPI00040F2CB7|nr:hypothetical protein [Methyloversatilis universalis]
MPTAARSTSSVTLNNANATLNLNGATGTLNSGGTLAGGTLAIDNASGGAFNTGYAGISGSSFGGTNVATLDNVRPERQHHRRQRR